MASKAVVNFHGKAHEPITCPFSQADHSTVSHIKDWLTLPPAIYVEETPEAGFREPVITEQDSYTEEEKARIDQFKEVKNVVEVTLKARQVFWAGETDIDVYLPGQPVGGAGLKTTIVQTQYP